MALDELIDMLCRAGAEAVLEMSARGVAREKHPGRRQQAIRWHGTQTGSRWKHAPMAPRWATASFLGAEQPFRQILGHQDLWSLQAKIKDRALSDDSSKAAPSTTRTAISTLNYVRDSFLSILGPFLKALPVPIRHEHF